jgi:hypothetical protein
VNDFEKDGNDRDTSKCNPKYESAKRRTDNDKKDIAGTELQ